MPIDFAFTEEQELFRKSIRELVAKSMVPRSKELMQARSMVPEVHKALTAAGFFGLLVPTEFGGSGADYVTFTIAVEELTKADSTGFVGLPAWYGASCARLISVYGSSELKEEVLPRVVKDGWLSPLHSTEPGCGTDFTAITTGAKKSGGQYLVNGEVLRQLRAGGGAVWRRLHYVSQDEPRAGQ